MDRIELVRRYFEACSNADAEGIAACFTADAVVYDTNLPPVRGAEALGKFWVNVRQRWGGAVWSIDRGVASDDAAACEWTMRGRSPSDGRPFTFRGSDHYRFVGDLIADVHQYWTFVPETLDTGLRGYPYDTPEA